MEIQIKFRAKHIKNGAWLYGDLLQSNEGSVYIGVHGQYIDDGYHFNEMYNETCYVDEDTIGQFTGLLDRNGKEIYEGDIIHLNDEEFELEHGNGVVLFLDRDSSGNPCGGMWYVGNADEDSNTETSLYDLNWEGALEVIGNRFDNPEMLKGGEE